MAGDGEHLHEGSEHDRERDEPGIDGAARQIGKLDVGFDECGHGRIGRDRPPTERGISGREGRGARRSRESRLDKQDSPQRTRRLWPGSQLDQDA